MSSLTPIALHQSVGELAGPKGRFCRQYVGNPLMTRHRISTMAVTVAFVVATMPGVYANRIPQLDELELIGLEYDPTGRATTAPVIFSAAISRGEFTDLSARYTPTDVIRPLARVWYSRPLGLRAQPASGRRPPRRFRL